MLPPTSEDDKLYQMLNPGADGRMTVGANLTLTIAVSALLIIRALWRIEKAIDHVGPS